MAPLNTETLIEAYISELREQFVTGHAREHAYRPALKKLMNSFDDVTAINDPKRSDNGNPDFVFLKTSNSNIILGYAEAKDITVDILKTAKTEQLRRYAGYEKLFLTNYLDFHFYRNGELYQTVSIGKLKDGLLIADEGQFDRLLHELKAFLELPPEKIKNGKRLSLIMGGKSRRVRDNVIEYLKDAEKSQELNKIYKLMKELLVHDLKKSKFADMYAQTLVYGLFVARYYDTTPESFSRAEARDLVPPSNPFLREFFDHIVGPRFDKRLAYIVDELCEVFSVSDVQDIVHKHLKVSEDTDDEKDPIIHFYEDFLKEYDPAERKKMGAYYTPVPVVKFMIGMVDTILKNDFSMAKGLADNETKAIGTYKAGSKQVLHRVQILDPAVGTATFLNEIIKYIHGKFAGQEGRWPSYAETELLPRLHGFELMMAPYTIAHLKLGMTLQETGVKNLDQRLGVYLTNSLEEGSSNQTDLFSQFGLAEVVAEESNLASSIKYERPIMVIIGNPPYSVISNNLTDYQRNLITKYKSIDGVPIKEKGALRLEMNLNDDYVKFIAFAEDIVEKNGEGVLAYINNNTWLDSNSHKGMRWHLLKTFDEIYVINLHGDEPDGQNVFAIKKAVCINIFVKRKGSKKNQATVFRTDVFGKQKSKFDWLLNTKPDDIKWNKITPTAPKYEFQISDSKLESEYKSHIALDDLFINFSTTILTARDGFAVDLDKRKLQERVKRFSDPEISDMTISEDYKIKGNVAWDLKEKRKSFIERHADGDIDGIVRDYDYRLFDKRYISYDDDIIQCPRKKVMANMLGHDNIALVTCRFLSSATWQHAFVTDDLVDDSFLSNKSKERGQAFVLYNYHDDGSRTPNLKASILKQLTANLTDETTPEEIFDYIYGILFSKNYRKRYNEFLRRDFPRIPIPQNQAEFSDHVKVGEKLRKVHLLKIEPTSYVTTYPQAGTDEVTKITQDEDKIWINEDQYFGGITSSVWEMGIGGYQPAQKWLKDRVGKILSSSDLEQYQKLIWALSETEKITS